MGGAAVIVGIGALLLVLALRSESAAPLDSAQVGTIASDVVGDAIEDLRSAPATSAVVYQQILPSLVQIETSGPSPDGEDGGFGTGWPSSLPSRPSSARGNGTQI